MNSILKKALIYLILPLIVIVLAWSFNIWLGIAALLLYIAIQLYLIRPMLFNMIGSKKYSLGQTEDALNWFKKAYDTKKASPRIIISYGYLLLKSTQLEKAEEVLRQVLNSKAEPGDITYAKSIFALVLWKKGELDAATDMLSEVIQTYKTTSVYGSLGYFLILKGDLEKALQFNLEAYDYNSSDNIILDNLGQNYFMLGMYDKSREIYETLIEKKPTFPEPYFNYGLLLEKLGEPEKALESMKKSLNYKFSYLSSISKEDVEAKIREAT
jgi:tetratricopeptide (TPR) repeat protein